MKKIIVALVFVFTCFGYSQVKIKGVVTYYFNEYQGNKPDIGTTVVVVDTSEVKKFDYEIWSNYHYGKGYRKINEIDEKILKNYKSLYDNSISDGDNEKAEKYKIEADKALFDLNENIKQIKKHNVDTDEKFNNIDKQLSTSLFQFRMSKDPFIETTVDGSGNYSINIKPGTYYVFIKSKNRTGLTITDVSGTTYITKVKVTNNDKDVSYNFELD
jgi:hypothetical protein